MTTMCATILKTSELAFSGFIRGTALQGLIYGVGVMMLHDDLRHRLTRGRGRDHRAC